VEELKDSEKRERERENRRKEGRGKRTIKQGFTFPGD